MTTPPGDPRPVLWIVSELYYPETVSTGHFVTGIAEGLASRLDVRVVCSQPSYSLRGRRAPREEVRNGVRILRVAPLLFDKNVLPLRILTSILVTISIGAALFRRAKAGDHVLVVTNPPILPYVVALICQLRSAKYTVLVHDVYPDVLIALGIIRSGGIADRILSAMVRRLYNGAQNVVVLGRDMARNVGARMADGGRIEIIPNWGDDDLISASPLPTGDPFVIQYLGNMGRTHDIDTLIEAARGTGDKGIQWMFVGDGARRGAVEAELAEKSTPNITLAARVAATELPATLARGHVSVIAFISGMAGISVPSRVYNAMCAGRPILLVADLDSEVAHLVSDHGIGWVVAPGDTAGLVQLVESLAADRARVANAGLAARRLAEASYTRPAVVERYRGLFGVASGCDAT